MPDPIPTLGHLTEDEWDQLQQITDRFEKAWEQGAPADLDPFLPPPGHRLRLIALGELVKIDLEARWKRGLGGTLEDYLERVRELRTAPSLWPGILHEEYCVRHQAGDRPPL